MEFLNNIIVQVIAGISLIILVAIWGFRKSIWIFIKRQTLSYKLKEYTTSLEERISKRENEMRLLEDTLQQRSDKNMTEINIKIQTELSLLKGSINKSQKDYEEEGKKKIDNLLKDIDYRITSSEAAINRSYAQHWEGKGAFPAAYVWWMRSTDKNDMANDKSLTKLSLDSAITCLGKMVNYSLGDAKYEIEMRDIIDAIRQRSNKWKVEINRIEELIQKKKYPPSNQ